jgi:hypothetical protein
MQWRAFSKWQIGSKVYASHRNIQRLRLVPLYCRLQDADLEWDFEAESISKASFCSIHGTRFLRIRRRKTGLDGRENTLF